MLLPYPQINQYQKNLELRAIVFAVIAVVIFAIVGTISIQFEKASETHHSRVTTVRGLLSGLAGKNITIE
ncbi:MAG: hypothetical protein K2X81_09590 [Candidatus Obscuribacterales bacterium]|nr:hypothetical protein [Candidatus Obscuribacterales bacterium]